VSLGWMLKSFRFEVEIAFKGDGIEEVTESVGVDMGAVERRGLCCYMILFRLSSLRHGRQERDETDGAREPPPSAIDVTWLDHVVALIIADHYLSGYFCMWITH
jgi:hypothetical protein